VTPAFVVSLVAWFVAIVALLLVASRLSDRRPRLAFALLMVGLLVMIWGVLFVMAA
jgi:hypothetical protein